MIDGNLIKIISMVLVGAVSGTLAARIVKGNNFGFIANSVLGIIGAVVGGYIFDFLNLTPGAGIVKMVEKTFEVSLPLNLVGMLVSATIGAVVVLKVFSLISKKK